MESDAPLEFLPTSYTRQHERRPRPVAVRGILRVGDLALITAGWDSFKSFLALELAWSLATGHPFLRRFQVENRLRMAVLQVEIDPGSYDARVHAFPPSEDLFTASALGWRFDRLAELHEAVDELGLDGVVLDPIGEMWPEQTARGELFSENTKPHVTAILHELKSWRKTVILVHHDPKPSQGMRNRASGSAALLNAPDTRILVDRVGQDRIQLEVRTRLQHSAGTVYAKFEGGRLHYVQPAPKQRP